MEASFENVLRVPKTVANISQLIYLLFIHIWIAQQESIPPEHGVTVTEKLLQKASVQPCCCTGKVVPAKASSGGVTSSLAY